MVRGEARLGCDGPGNTGKVTVGLSLTVTYATEHGAGSKKTTQDTLASTWACPEGWPLACSASRITPISISRTTPNNDAIQDGRAAALGVAGGAACVRWSDGARTDVAATKPSTAAVPTAYQGYCWVHQLTFAASLAVACMSVTVCCMAVLASAACCARKARASLVLEYRFFCSPVSNAVSECGLLLELAFVILLYLLLAPPAVPGTHANDDTKNKKD